MNSRTEKRIIELAIRFINLCGREFRSQREAGPYMSAVVGKTTFSVYYNKSEKRWKCCARDIKTKELVYLDI